MGLRHSKKCQVSSELADLIKTEDITVFISPRTKPCFQTVELLKSLQLRPFIVNLDSENNLSEIRQALFQFSGQYDLPIIFVKGAFFGSQKELRKAVLSGQFQALLKKHRIKFSPLDDLWPAESGQ
jgi:glutaredoxin-related protein